MSAESSPGVRTGRVYDDPDPDADRVLVDGLWPRGVRKADLDAEWLREVAPTSELRRWYDHRPERFAEFERRYRKELADGPAAAGLDDLVRRARSGSLVLLTAARDLGRSQAEVLRRVVSERVG